MNHPEELRCVIAIIRHGDRTPKQKMKMVVTYPHILAYYERHTSKPGSVSVMPLLHFIIVSSSVPATTLFYLAVLF